MAKQQTNYGRAFLFGGISGCGATLVMHPMDVIRVQIQIDGHFSFPISLGVFCSVSDMTKLKENLYIQKLSFYKNN